MQTSDTQLLRIVIVGHVDHGKSTLVGRFLHDTGALADGKFEAIQASCQRRGVPFEWAFLMDALQAERDQNITIDVSQIAFKTAAGRPGVLIDAPGHKEFLKNMITGAARADAALLLIAANEGVREQSRRHGYLLSLLGIRQVAVVVNKMDAVDYQGGRVPCHRNGIPRVPRRLQGRAARVHPGLGARGGQRRLARGCRHAMVHRGRRLPECSTSSSRPFLAADGPLRLPVQDVYRFDARRIVAGRIESGTLRVGDELVFSPFNKTAVVASIERWPETGPAVETACAGESVGITLTEQIFIERGHVASHRTDAPVESNRVKANVFWLGRRELTLGAAYKLKLGTQELECTVASIDRVIDAVHPRRAHRRQRRCADRFAQRRGRTHLPDAQAAGVGQPRPRPGDGAFRARRWPRGQRRRASCSAGCTPTGGASSARTSSGARAPSPPPTARLRNGHKGAVVWLTGLSGAGKSTIANLLENELFQRY